MQHLEFRTAHQFVKVFQIMHPDSYFFSPDTLKFFNERVAKMSLKPETEMVEDSMETVKECYVITSPRTQFDKQAIATHYFEADTLRPFKTETKVLNS